MIKKCFSAWSKSKQLLALFAIFFFFGVNAYSETIEEDFENVTVVDGNGQPLANSWSAGAGLSNGWRIIDGTIFAGDYGDYGLIHSEGSGFALSNYYLTSASTSVNNAYIYIPIRVRGQVMVWARSNLNEKSKQNSSLKVYEATADGDVMTSKLLYSATPTKGSSEWKPFYFTIEDEGKYIALNLVYTDIDHFSATIDDGTPVIPTLSLSVSTLDFGTLSSDSTMQLIVKSNVTTSVSYAITGSDHDAFEVTDAPAVLPADVAKPVTVKMSASEAGDYQATLKITAGELTEKVILKGTWEEKTPGTDPDDPATVWKGEDFTGLTEIPSTWTVDDDASWEIVDWGIDTAPGLKGYSGFICTPMFTIAKGQTLEFYFQKGLSYSWNSKCTVYYSTDKQNWTEVESYDSYTDDGVKTIEFPAPGNYYLGLNVNNTTYFDNFRIVGGAVFSLSDLPAIIAAIANGQDFDVNNDGKTDIGDIIFVLTIDN